MDAPVVGLLAADWTELVAGLGVGVLGTGVTGRLVGVSGAGVDCAELTTWLLCIDGVCGE